MDHRDDHILTQAPAPAFELENVERMAARGFVIFGGVFWMIAAFAGPFVFKGTSVQEAVQVALWPFLATAVTLLIGWFYERLAAFLLAAGGLAVLAWGVMYAWEPGVWMIMSTVLIAPMVIAAVLFLLASHSETIKLRTVRETVNQPASEPAPAPRPTV